MPRKDKDRLAGRSAADDAVGDIRDRDDDTGAERAVEKSKAKVIVSKKRAASVEDSLEDTAVLGRAENVSDSTGRKKKLHLEKGSSVAEQAEEKKKVSVGELLLQERELRLKTQLQLRRLQELIAKSTPGSGTSGRGLNTPATPRNEREVDQGAEDSEQGADHGADAEEDEDDDDDSSDTDSPKDRSADEEGVGEEDTAYNGASATAMPAPDPTTRLMFGPSPKGVGSRVSKHSSSSSAREQGHFPSSPHTHYSAATEASVVPVFKTVLPDLGKKRDGVDMLVNATPPSVKAWLEKVEIYNKRHGEDNIFASVVSMLAHFPTDVKVTLEDTFTGWWASTPDDLVDVMDGRDMPYELKEYEADVLLACLRHLAKEEHESFFVELSRKFTDLSGLVGRVATFDDVHASLRDWAEAVRKLGTRYKKSQELNEGKVARFVFENIFGRSALKELTNEVGRSTMAQPAIGHNALEVETKLGADTAVLLLSWLRSLGEKTASGDYKLSEAKYNRT